ncbi:hypothetical protein EC968_000485, partial [Mortierella alpina]
MVGDKEYTLAAVMYGNGRHFSCVAMIDGRALSYDGIRRNRLKWLTPKENIIPSKYQICQVWYLDKNGSSGTKCSEVDNISHDSEEEDTIMEGEQEGEEETRIGDEREDVKDCEDGEDGDKEE